jgi:hypothetical protein
LIKRLVHLIRLFKSWRFARAALVLAMVILLCVGAFLSLFQTGLEVPTVLRTADSPHVDKGASWNGHRLDAIYLADFAKEAEEADKHPVNAELLSALLLLALSFGATVVWSLANGWWHRAFRFVGLGRWFVSALEDRPFLCVFRL